MFEEMLGLGAGGGGELQPAPPGTPPEQLTAQWGEFLKNPKTQAALLNFGLEMMKPRWNPASALPDAIGAGVKTIGGMEEEERAIAEQRRREGLSAGDKASDRATRLEAARIGADSRAEVAGIRAASALDSISARQQLKGPVYERLRLQYIDNYIKSAQKEDSLRMNGMEGLTGKFQPRDAAVLRQQAEAWAEQQLRSGVGQIFDPGGIGGGGNPQPTTRPNSPTPGPSVGPAAAPGTPKPTSVNTPNQGGVSSKDLINRLLATSPGGTQGKLLELKTIVSDPAKLARMKQGVKDPEQLEALIQQMLRRMR